MTKKLKFSELGLSKELLKAVADMGYEEASPIQSEAIPVVMQGSDILGQAMTGSGKTAAFGIPAIEKVDVKGRSPQVIILCPIRELAVQVADQISKLARHKLGATALPIYGGQPIERQIQGLRKGPQIIIGTPGRVLDHINRKTLSLKNITMVVLDEADEMLNMGFRDDIEAILQSTPEARQTLMFSATMPAQIQSLARRFQKNPVIIKIAHDTKLTTPSIEQFYFEIESFKKLDLFTRLIDIHNPKLSIAFCNTKRRVDELVADLRARGYEAEGIHGDLTQQKRNKVMERFRRGDIEILVATDVAARGIDVSNVEAVFNFEMPQDEESYVHRIGRTGRAGKSGKAFSLVSGSEIYRLRDIKRYTKAVITRMPIPSFQEVEAMKTTKLLDDVRKVISQKNFDQYLQAVETLMKEEYTSLDVAAALLKMYTSKK
jgi:ATP-dependent RNA helicase DeaD